MFYSVNWFTVISVFALTLGLWLLHSDASTFYSDDFQVEVRTDVVHLNDVISTVNYETSKQLTIDYIALNEDQVIITYTGYGRQTGEYDFANVFEFKDGEFVKYEK